MRRAHEATQRHGHGVFTLRKHRPGEAEVDHLHHQLLILTHEHQIGRFNVAMHQAVLLRRIERARHLIGDLQGEQRAERPLPLDQRFERLAVDVLHRIKPRRAGRPEMKDRGHIAMPHPRRRARLPHEAPTRCLAVEIISGDDLQGHRDVQILIVSLVGHPHRSASEFEKRTVVANQHLIVLEVDRLWHGEACGPGEA